jgi:hypothetical protein
LEHVRVREAGVGAVDQINLKVCQQEVGRTDRRIHPASPIFVQSRTNCNRTVGRWINGSRIFVVTPLQGLGAPRRDWVIAINSQVRSGSVRSGQFG